MSERTRTYSDILSLYFIGISFFGLYLLCVLTFYTPISTINFPLKRQLIGSIFGAICISGIIAGVSPSRCSWILHFKSQKKSSHRTNQIETGEITNFSGHHPICRNFSDHVFHLGNRTYCAGCTGMVLGATISLIGSFLYFFCGFHLGEVDAIIFWLGFIGVIFGLLQNNLLNLKSGVNRLFLNTIFVFGAFLLLIGINEITDNLVIEFYLLIIIAYWIMTRIFLSQRKHRKVCDSCSLKSCARSHKHGKHKSYLYLR